MLSMAQLEPSVSLSLPLTPSIFLPGNKPRLCLIKSHCTEMGRGVGHEAASDI